MEDFPNYPDLRDKVALIMGIGQSGPTDTDIWGNGAAIARVFSHNKVRVVGCDLSLPAAQHTKQRLQAEGGDCEVMQADVTNAEDVQRVVDTVLSKYGRIDILVNNVGVAAAGDAVTMTEEIWDRQININLKSVYLACRAILPIMVKQQSGTIINNASIAGLRFLGKPQVAYNTAKAAVIHYTKVTAARYADKGIRVNAIAPGLMYTPLVEKFRESGDPADQEFYKKIVNHNVPMGTMGDALDVANGVTFLASKSARYIAGHVLVVDGALTVSTGT